MRSFSVIYARGEWFLIPGMWPGIPAPRCSVDHTHLDCGSHAVQKWRHPSNRGGSRHTTPQQPCSTIAQAFALTPSDARTQPPAGKPAADLGRCLQGHGEEAWLMDAAAPRMRSPRLSSAGNVASKHDCWHTTTSCPRLPPEKKRQPWHKRYSKDVTRV